MTPDYEIGDVYTAHSAIGDMVRRRGSDGVWRTHPNDGVDGQPLTDKEVTFMLAAYPDQGDCVWRNGTLIVPKVAPDALSWSDPQADPVADMRRLWQTLSSDTTGEAP